MTRDLFGFADVLAVHPVHGTLAVQATSRSHARDRAQKVVDCADALQCSLSGWEIEVWGWDYLPSGYPRLRRLLVTTSPVSGNLISFPRKGQP